MNFFPSLNCRGHLLSLDRPRIMGILNLTPDSFSDGGRYQTLDQALFRVEKMLAEGADMIDLGGYSSRPYADPVSEAEELRRIADIGSHIMARFPQALLSVDTYRPGVAKEMLDRGVHLINDISAGTGLGEPSSIGQGMMSLLAECGDVPYLIMHMQGKPEDMQDRPTYASVIEEVWDFLVAKLRECQRWEIKDVVIDPGFGFGKSIPHNYELLYGLKQFRQLNQPLLVGLSRKSMMYRLLETEPGKVQAATAALHWKSLELGAQILRVHDVAEAQQLVQLYTHLRTYEII